MCIILVYQDMPCHVRALTNANGDGSYTININARLSHEMQKSAVLHELMHIKGNDFDAERECKIVCVNRYCMNLLYAPYWGKQR